MGKPSVCLVNTALISMLIPQAALAYDARVFTKGISHRSLSRGRVHRTYSIPSDCTGAIENGVPLKAPRKNIMYVVRVIVQEEVDHGHPKKPKDVSYYMSTGDYVSSAPSNEDDPPPPGVKPTPLKRYPHQRFDIDLSEIPNRISGWIRVKVILRDSKYKFSGVLTRESDKIVMCGAHPGETKDDGLFAGRQKQFVSFYVWTHTVGSNNDAVYNFALLPASRIHGRSISIDPKIKNDGSPDKLGHRTP